MVLAPFVGERHCSNRSFQFGRQIERTKGPHAVMPALATISRAVLVDKSGVDTDTISSYERLGLISRPRRMPNGLQLYPADEAERVNFIRRSLELGFPVQSVREMLGIGRKKSVSCSDIYAIAERQLDDIRRRVADLRCMEAALAPLVEACPQGGSLDNCNIVKALSQPPPGLGEKGLSSSTNTREGAIAPQ